MTLLTFPSSPTNGEIYPTTPLVGQNQYQWDAATSTWLLLGAASGVTYGNSTNVGQFTVNSAGIITFAQNVPISSGGGSGTVTSVATGTGLTGGPVTTTGTISLANTAVSAGSYTYAALTVDAQGRLTAASSGNAPVCCSSYTAKGTILAASAASTPTALAVGTNGQVLIADSTCTTGVKWGAAAAATPTVAGIVLGCTTATNSALGCSALYSNTTGSYNIANGVNALFSNTTGSFNTANGVDALNRNTTGNQNTANGLSALYLNTTGGANTANGLSALYSNTTGCCNTANGVNALYCNTTGSNNTANGFAALFCNTTGNFNSAIGVNALGSITTGSGNIGIGGINSAGVFAPAFNITTENDRISMGSTSVTNAYIQVAWTAVSDARDKIVAGPVLHGLDFVQQLQPKEFHFKETRDSETPHGPSRYGFLAQDILALEGDHPVIINDEDSNKLRYTSDHLLPVMVNAIKELSEIVSDLRQELNELKVKS